MMDRIRRLPAVTWISMVCLGLALLGLSYSLMQQRVQAQANTVEAPVFEVDPLWPKPLPNHWLLGMAIGIW
ncbi:MAG: hypothetical protein FGM44_05075, partial [Limnohabitans sp.]|nr:hypothetical protein [Limnohabitans sp.]